MEQTTQAQRMPGAQAGAQSDPQQQIAELTAQLAEQRQIVESLRRSEALFRSLVEQSLEGIVVIDEQGTVVEWNQGEEQITGLKRSEVLGQTLWDVQFRMALDEERTPANYEMGRQRVMDALHAGDAPWLYRLFEREIARPDGTRRVIQSLTFPIHTEGGLMVGSTSRDVTERRQAEAAIENTARFPAENPHPVLRLDQAGTILYANEASRPLLDEWASHVGGLAPAAWRELIGATFESAIPGQVDVACGERLFALVVVPIPAAGYVNLYGSDVTERRLALETSQRRQAEVTALLAAARAVLTHRDFAEAARAIFDVCKELLGATAGYVALTEDNGNANQVVFLDAGGQACQVDPALPMPIRGLRAEAYRAGQAIYDNDFAESGWTELLPEGHAHLENVLFAPLIVEGQAAGLLGLANKPGGFDEHDARLATAFAELAAIALWNARLYEQAMELAVLEERQRLSRDLHDAVSQTLFSASLIAEVLPRVWEKNPEAGRQSLRELYAMNRGALSEMRLLLAELRPAAMTEIGLDRLLSHLAIAATGRTHIPVTVKLEAPGRLPPAVQIAFYRVAQEALSNVAKHSGASQVELSLSRLPTGHAGQTSASWWRGLELQVSDNGRGFDPDCVASGCLGLGIMRERIQEIGATLDVESRPGGGTRIRVRWAGG